MAGLVERLTERDPPRSRNTLDDEEEAAAEAAREAAPAVKPEIVLGEGCKLPEEATLVVIAVGQPLGEAAGAALSAGAICEVGEVKDDVARAAICVLGKGQGLLVKCAQPIPEDRCFDWAEAIVGVLGPGRPARLVVLDSLKTAQYICDGARCEPPLLRHLATSPAAREACAALGVPPLETGNVVTGLGAAVLTEAQLRHVPAAFSLLTLRESVLEAAPLQAVLAPLSTVLGEALGADDDDTWRRPEAEARQAIAAIRERREADQIYS